MPKASPQPTSQPKSAQPLRGAPKAPIADGSAAQGCGGRDRHSHAYRWKNTFLKYYGFTAICKIILR